MNPAVTTIRKLLRLAKRAPGAAERDAARTRAQELMRRHHVIVNDDDGDEVSEHVRGVRGVPWRERLLGVCGLAHHCKVGHPTMGVWRHTIMVVQGDRADVKTTLAYFNRLVAEILSGLALGLKRRGLLRPPPPAPVGGGYFLGRSLLDRNREAHIKAAAVYTRMFLNCAIDEALKAAASQGVGTAPSDKAPGVGMGASALQANLEGEGEEVSEEVDLLFADLNELQQYIGATEALRIKSMGESDGMGFGPSLRLLEAPKQLMASSEAFHCGFCRARERKNEHGLQSGQR